MPPESWSSPVPQLQKVLTPLRNTRSNVIGEQSDETFMDITSSLRESSTSPGSFNEASKSSSPPESWKHILFSPVQAFNELEQSKEDVSLLTQSVSSSTIADGLNLPLVGEVRWVVVKAFIKDWLKSPKNLALLLWGLAVGVSGALLFLVMTGLLDKQLPSKRVRDAWFEVNNQILNALFALMCVYLHPERCLHLVMLLRWTQQDITKLRQVYCKHGTYKPHEWAHMLVVVLLLHLNCFAQYALCGLNWGFKRSERPPVGVGLCLAVAIGAPAAAGVYSILSPLGKDFQIHEESELHTQETAFTQQEKLERTPSLRIIRVPKICCGEVSFMSRDGALVQDPEWQGALFDCCNDPPVAVLSALCPFCVFGWNMERLGFGNRYVHIVTFILLCTAPYWIFNLAAINIDNVQVRKGLGISGIILCIFGLLYGGFWRIHMRKTFRLPAETWCFGKSFLTDYMQWLFCAPCALCQEVRTSEYYRIRESNFYERRASSEISPTPSLSLVRTPRGAFISGPEAPNPSPSSVSTPHGAFVSEPEASVPSPLVVRTPRGASMPGQEASSPLPFTAFSPSLSSLASDAHSAVGYSRVNEDTQMPVLPDILTRDYMKPPAPQVLFP